MTKSEHNAKRDQSLLTLKLLRNYDELTEFAEDCSFLCEAFNVLATNNDRLDQYTLGGFERNAQWLKHRAIEIKLKLRIIRDIDSAGAFPNCGSKYHVLTAKAQVLSISQRPAL
jgi:hypothetical protein